MKEEHGRALKPLPRFGKEYRSFADRGVD